MDLELLAEIAKYIKVDPSSPSGLRWIKRLGPRVGAGAPAGRQHSTGYWHVGFKGKKRACHRLVLLLSGIFPNDSQTDVDHIDRDKSNNTLSNLRWATRSENAQNTSTRGAVPYRYVWKHGNGYVGSYWNRTKQKNIYVGHFSAARDAHHAAILHKLENFWCP